MEAVPEAEAAAKESMRPASVAGGFSGLTARLAACASWKLEMRIATLESGVPGPGPGPGATRARARSNAGVPSRVLTTLVIIIEEDEDEDEEQGRTG